MTTLRRQAPAPPAAASRPDSAAPSLQPSLVSYPSLLLSPLLAAVPSLTHLTILAYTMPTELPYAADAEEALSYDELEVCTPHQRVSSELSLTASARPLSPTPAFRSP